MPYPTLVPPARNLAIDPKPNSASYIGMNAAVGTVGIVAGQNPPENLPYSVELITTSSSSFAMIWAATINSDAVIEAMNSGTFYYSWWAKGPNLVQRVFRPYIRYVDGGVNTDVFVPAMTAEWQRYSGSIDIDPARVIQQLRFYVHAPSTAETIYLAGLDIRWNQVPDEFVHGDRGRYYFWEGTPNNSRSQRAQHFTEVPESEWATVPSGRNLAHNPRPVSTTHWTIVGAGTSGGLTSEKSYSGDQSIRVTTINNLNLVLRWVAAADDDADIAAITANDDIYASIAVAGPLSLGDWRIRLRILHTDSTDKDAALVLVPALSEGFTRVLVGPVRPDVGKVLRRITLNLEEVNPAGSTIYAGGLDIRVNSIPDAFIHGSAGEKYSWEGAVNNSPSRRVLYVPTPIVGSGGQIRPSVAVEVVSRQGAVKRDITSHFLDGSVTYDLDADGPKGTCTITLDEPDLIDPYADEYARVKVRIEKGSAVAEGPVGMFLVEAPSERWQGGHDQWTYPGRDMLALLDTFMLRGNVEEPVDAESEPTVSSAFVLQEGQSYRAALDQILSGANYVKLSPSQYSFSGAMDEFADDSMAWEGGTSALTIVSDILQGAGWSKPWVTPAGIITSAPAGTDPSLITPSLAVVSGENSILRWPFEVEYDASQIGNRVRVISFSQNTKKGRKRKKKKRRPDTVTRAAMQNVYSIADVSHPLSFERLGRWIDLPDVRVPLLEDPTKLDPIGAKALTDAAQLPIRVRLTTEVLLRGLNEVYSLNIADSHGEPIESGQGRYFCRGWSLQLGSPWEMVHNLSRVIPITVAPFY